jgi:hypothetical protein
MPLKIAGIEMKGPKTKLLVFPRDGYDIPLKFVAVSDDTMFDVLCPEPKPPTGLKPGVGKVEIRDDPNYLAKRQLHGKIREDWFVIQSLKPSNIEWEIVKENDPETWGKWRQELKDAGFSLLEVNTIYQTFIETNVVTEDMLSEARSRFLASPQESLSEKQ